jgi:hypothetical protein
MWTLHDMEGERDADIVTEIVNDPLDDSGLSNNPIEGDPD